MGDVIYFEKHPVYLKNRKAKTLTRYCTLLKKYGKLSTCRGFDLEKCGFCEVPKRYKEARKNLNRLILTGSINE